MANENRHLGSSFESFGDEDGSRRRAVIADIAARRNPNRRPTHPGELLRDIIPVTGKSNAEIAALLGIPRRQLSSIINGRKAVSPAIALRFGKMFGDGPNVWLRMQAAYDLWGVEQELREEIEQMPTLVVSTYILTADERAAIAEARVTELLSDEAVASFWKRFWIG